MKWSWRIARIAGIDVRVHATFLLLLLFVGLDAHRRYGSVEAGFVGAAWVIVLFVIVLMHEYGHAFAARRYGIGTQDITLLPIGGLARLERMPREPRQELVVAIAGPAVNVVLAALLWAGLHLAGSPPDPTSAGFASQEALVGRRIAERLLAANVILAVFNLIPAFPMDGGRVLRALMAWRTGDFRRATMRAAEIGRALALLLGLVGAFGLGRIVAPNGMLVLVALFVWIAAASEAAAVSEEGELAELPLSRVMQTDVRTLSPDESLARAVEQLLAGFQQDFPVVEHGRVVGVLARRDLIPALKTHGTEAPVRAVMRTDFIVATPEEPIEEALARLKACGCQALPVVRGQTLLGLLTLDNVGEYIMIRAALRGAR
ncbi:site-2 protease family protein [Roseisolibacter sp. H3M3-2]|uniref:site-2 protease family protein n=1 Tax=Roseisolibacter sp. H3M3-2 TaxID=3031323 RepID=UPI0023DC1B4D|nr:site-2 protease family protein [Roseisolibacter sp. H3M3-2]MDF1501916.1 site-2 protease family protein [Roseisolibacter sp. H3M3-2]